MADEIGNCVILGFQQYALDKIERHFANKVTSIPLFVL
jgi:hypothetical protein